MSVNTLKAPVPFATAKDMPHGGFWKTLRDTLVSIREGIDMAAEYQTLTNRGLAPDVAARKAFERIGKN